ncbi:MAG: hypothetical protein R3C02_06390 [Planctomycetaceae bacterium]
MSVPETLESYHDAQQALDTAINLFNTGHLLLDQRVISEDLFFANCRKIYTGLFKELEYIPEELQGWTPCFRIRCFAISHCFSPCRTAGLLASCFP